MGKMGYATFWAIFHQLIWSPWSEPVSVDDAVVGKRIVFLHIGAYFEPAAKHCKQLGGVMPIPKNKEDFDSVFRPGLSALWLRGQVAPRERDLTPEG
jgi:hypothetical protein